MADDLKERVQAVLEDVVANNPGVTLISDGDLASRIAAAPAAPPPAEDFDKAAPPADDLYQRAIAIILRDEKASTSYVQRRFQIGYNRAAALIDRMEAEGLLTPPNHKGVREITQKMRDNHQPAEAASDLENAEEIGRTVASITVDMDAKCAECKQPGRCDNGLCMGCTTKAMRGEPMNTPTGQEVRHRLHNQKTGENSGMAKSGFAKDQLKSFINRIERLEEEKAALAADIKEVYSEAKGTGFDTKIIRQVIRMRKLDKADFQEQEAMLDLYLTAMDMR